MYRYTKSSDSRILTCRSFPAHFTFGVPLLRHHFLTHLPSAQAESPVVITHG